MKPIKVHVGYYKHRHEWMLYYHDPSTSNRKRVFKKTGIDGRPAKAPKTSTKYKPTESSRKDALRMAAEWEGEVNSSQTNITWERFRERYENEVLRFLAKSTDEKFSTVFDSIGKFIDPKHLRDITSQRLSQYQAKLRDEGMAGKKLSEHTVASYLSCIRSFLNWAVDVELLPSIPRIPFPSRASKGKAMKGRPITQEEFERMLKVLPKIMDKYAIPSWRHFLEGLWWSGLRLAESLQLYWDDDRKLRPVLAGKESFLHIPAELEKGNKDRLLPIAPEFATFLSKTPEAKRKGPVFRPLPIKKDGPGRKPPRVGVDHASHVISTIGKKANVVVSRDQSGKKIKYASAHDLRRAFGTRWSKRIMPPQLQQLMRHEDIQTTMRYYVEDEARTTAKILWDAFSKSQPVEPTKRQQKRQQPHQNDVSDSQS